MADRLRELRDKFEQEKDSDEYRLDSHLFDISEAISIRMDQMSMTKADLARSIHVSRARVTRMLEGSNNFTIRSLMGIAHAVDCDLDIRFTPCEANEVATVYVYRTPLETMSHGYVPKGRMHETRRTLRYAADGDRMTLVPDEAPSGRLQDLSIVQVTM